MTKKEYKTAVRKAKRIFGYVKITDQKRQAVQLSKAKALSLVQQVPDDAKVGAMWASEDQMFLLVG